MKPTKIIPKARHRKSERGSAWNWFAAIIGIIFALLAAKFLISLISKRIDEQNFKGHIIATHDKLETAVLALQVLRIERTTELHWTEKIGMSPEEEERLGDKLMGRLIYLDGSERVSDWFSISGSYYDFECGFPESFTVSITAVRPNKNYHLPSYTKIVKIEYVRAVGNDGYCELGPKFIPEDESKASFIDLIRHKASQSARDLVNCKIKVFTGGNFVVMDCLEEFDEAEDIGVAFKPLVQDDGSLSFTNYIVMSNLGSWMVPGNQIPELSAYIDDGVLKNNEMKMVNDRLIKNNSLYRLSTNIFDIYLNPELENGQGE